MGAFRLHVTGLQKAKTNLMRMPTKVVMATKAALSEEAEALMADSKENYVPVDLGTLRSSGHVQLPVKLGPVIYVDLGYGGAAAPYALRVHENPRAGKTGGVSPSGQPYKHWAKVGGWKYLERPYQQRVRGMRSRIDAGVKRRLEVLK